MKKIVVSALLVVLSVSMSFANGQKEAIEGSAESIEIVMAGGSVGGVGVAGSCSLD